MILTKLLRYTRGVMSTAILWSIPWAIAGVVVRIVAPTESGPFPTLTMLGWSALHLGAIGFASGIFFAAVVAAVAERGVDVTRPKRMISMGIVAALLLPLLALAVEGRSMPPGLELYVAQQLATFVSLGALCAACTTWLLRRPVAGDSGPMGVMDEYTSASILAHRHADTIAAVPPSHEELKRH